MKRALITGITGQDGSYLAELLLSKGYEVHGIYRRASTFNTRRIDHMIVDKHSPGVKLFLEFGDLANSEWLTHLLYEVQPDEVYHLGAQSHVRVSFDIPEYTADVTGLGTTRILDAIRRTGSKCRFYQASSSEMFGAANPPQDESTVFLPRSPYAAAKVYAYWMTRIYRDGFAVHATNGILFNHESPRRGETFVTRKITRALAQIVAQRQSKLYLGNLDAKRDWGYAPDYVQGMWLALQQEHGDDYVLGTGEAHSVREFLEEAFGYLNLDYRQHVETDPYYLRPLEVDYLCANPAKAKAKLGWSPSVTFCELVRIMVDADLELLNLPSPGEGKRILQERFASWHHWGDSVTKVLLATEGSAAR